ncbi:MAG: glycosyltransferase family 9 protein [Alphaproteobacteria bacterium]|nr:glycosyltransferase family 9 protein [Alphaproteobacteria bacterium]
MRILIIKLSAFGDMVQAIPAFQSVRRHYPDAQIDLFTAPLFADFANQLKIGKLKIFDNVIKHQRFAYHRLGQIKKIRQMIKGQYDQVIDLQCVTRTANYFYFCCPNPPLWAGVAKYATISYKRRFLENLKPYQRHQLLLNALDIPYQFGTDNAWVKELPQKILSPLKNNKKYVLLVAGSSPKHPEKCWKIENYAKIANILLAHNITPVLIGAGAEQGIAKKIIQLCPKICNLVGKTSLQDIAVLAKNAYYGVGNDTGAMHLIAQMGTKCLVLFAGKNNPDLCKPPYSHCLFIQVQDLTTAELTVDMVLQQLTQAGVIANRNE